MGIFDWIPTIDEVTNFVECRVLDHKWVKIVADDGSIFVICGRCGKIK